MGHYRSYCPVGIGSKVAPVRQYGVKTPASISQSSISATDRIADTMCYSLYCSIVACTRVLLRGRWCIPFVNWMSPVAWVAQDRRHFEMDTADHVKSRPDRRLIHREHHRRRPWPAPRTHFLVCCYTSCGDVYPRAWKLSRWLESSLDRINPHRPHLCCRKVVQPPSSPPLTPQPRFPCVSAHMIWVANNRTITFPLSNGRADCTARSLHTLMREDGLMPLLSSTASLCHS